MVENVAPKDVWTALSADPSAVLVDVRTDAEWNFVGIPDLSAVGKEALLISWQSYPRMEVNADFVGHLKRAGVGPEQSVYFICRSGARSMAAAQAAAQAGYRRVFNVATGFEGGLDGSKHRGTVGGWKADGLAWKQG